MGRILSSLFHTSTSLLTSVNQKNCSEDTRRKIRIVFDALLANPKVTHQRLEGLLSQIPKNENILQVLNEEGYNLLQKCVGLNNLELVRWIVSRNVDLNRGACSFPLHIACLRGYDDIVEYLIKHGARVDVEARMCWPGPHGQNCEQRGRNFLSDDNSEIQRGSDKLQSAICYAFDGDQVETLELLVQHFEDHWLPWHTKIPLLHTSCERGAWQCTRYLVSERSEELNQCFDEYYPIHQACLHEPKFIELLLACGADPRVRTATQQMNLLHVLFLLGKKSADDTFAVLKLLLDNGLRDLINEPDSLGNTPLHALVMRSKLEQSRYGCLGYDPQPWNKWDTLHLVRYMVQNGASPSINQVQNSLLACVLRHIRDWEFRFELLEFLLQHGGNPNIAGRDGSLPLMVCLVPLINKDPLHQFTHTMKVYYLNCVRVLCKHGANTNCSSRINLTPLHVLMYSATENFSRSSEKAEAFDFIRQLLVILLQHGLDPNIRFNQRIQHILLALVDMLKHARFCEDLNHVHDLTRTLLQYGADPNVLISEPIFATNSFSSATKPKVQVLYYYVQFLLQREEFLADPERTFERVMWLYFSAMQHHALHSCLRLVLAQASMLPSRHGLEEILRAMISTPRSLKQIARVTIYESIKRRPAANVSKLPLPTPLKDYILNLAP